MLQKLSDVEERFEELNRRLSEPGITQNLKLMRDLSREHRDLEKIVVAYRALKQTSDELEGNRFILEHESDSELVSMAKEEIALLQKRYDEQEASLKLLLLPRDPNDSKNVILEIRSGTGGDEAALFAGELFKMYLRYAESKGFRVEMMSMSPGTQGGVKEVIILLEGEDAYSHFKYESGVHRVQRVPATETQGRVHTSAVTVAVLPEAEDIDIDLQDKDLRFDVYRSGGPGGQSVNTTDSAVRVTHIPTGLAVACQDEKSQHKNKAKALKILKTRLLDMMQAEQDAKISAERKSMVKTGDRSEKVRTYNFPQDRLTDHRIGLTLHNLPKLMQGGIEDLIVALRTYYQAEALKGGS